MTDATHDTLQNLERGTPALYLWSARALPAAIGIQFLLAGQSLFGGLPWDLHSLVGGLVALPALYLAGTAAAMRHLRGFGWWAGLIFVLYVVQIGLAAAGPSALAFHPFNAALLLTASLVLLFKVERRSRHRT